MQGLQLDLGLFLSRGQRWGSWTVYPGDKSGSLRCGCKKRVKLQGAGCKPWERFLVQPALEPRGAGRGAGTLMEPQGPSLGEALFYRRGPELKWAGTWPVSLHGL